MLSLLLEDLDILSSGTTRSPEFCDIKERDGFVGRLKIS